MVSKTEPTGADGPAQKEDGAKEPPQDHAATLAALEDAVWKRVALEHPELSESLTKARERIRADRGTDQPRGLWTRLTHSPIAVLTPIVALLGAFWQLKSNANDLAVQEAQAKRQVRMSLITAFLSAESIEKKISVLETAQVMPSVMAKCPEASQQASLLGMDSVFQTQDCEARRYAQEWVDQQAKVLKNLLTKQENLRLEAGGDTDGPVPMEGVDPSPPPDRPSPPAVPVGVPESDAITVASERALDQQVSRIMTEERLQALTATEPAQARAKPSNRDRARAVWRTGYNLFERGSRDAAKEKYEEALKIDKTYYAALNSLGRLEAEGGDPAAAIRYYERALDSQPDYGPALYNRAIAYARLGDSQKTRDAWVHARKTDPYYSGRFRARDRIATSLNVSKDAFPL